MWLNACILINAEIDPMGGAVDGGIGDCIEASPRRAAIEKAQAELRKEYNVREERRRELEFLKKGGNPLDFKFRHMASLSLQSTSVAGYHRGQLNSSGEKGSLSVVASPGDSVESSDKPGLPFVSGRKSTDSPALLDGENDMLQGEASSFHLRRKNNIISSEQSSQMDGYRNAKESEDSAIFRPYARRNRTKTKHDGAQFSSAGGSHYRGGQGSFVSRASIREMKGSSTETNSQKVMPKLLGMNGDIVSRTATPESCLDGKVDGEQAFISMNSLKQNCLHMDEPEITTEGSKDENQHMQQFGNHEIPDLAYPGTGVVLRRKGMALDGTDNVPSLDKEIKVDYSGKLHASRDFKGGSETICNEVQMSCDSLDRKSSDSSTHPTVVVDLKKGSVWNGVSDFNCNENTMLGSSKSEKNQKQTVGKEDIRRTIDITASNENHSIRQNQTGSGATDKVIEKTSSMSDFPKEFDDTPGTGDEKHGAHVETQNVTKEINSRNLNPERENFSNMRSPIDISSHEAPSSSLSGMERNAPTDCQTFSNNLSMKDKSHEDNVLEEARIIQDKNKRIAELSGCMSYLENHQRFHWDTVLEEMAWLSNDFAQERLWKMTAAAQLCQQIASLSRYRYAEQIQKGRLKLLAHNLAKAVLQFWQSAEVLLDGSNLNLTLEPKRCESQTKDTNTGSTKKTILQPHERSIKVPIHAYAIRFLRDSNALVDPGQAFAPKTPDIISDVDIPEVSQNDHLTEESLFYSIPSGAMESYRKSIEVYVIECKRTGCIIPEIVVTPVANTITDQGYEEIAYDEDKAENSAYYSPIALDGSKPLKFTHKKRKNPRFYGCGPDLSHGHYITVTQPSMLVEKRPVNLTISSIPAKRMRTANVLRQRARSPLGAGAYCNIQAQAEMEVSSGDVDSIHDDQNSLLGGSRIQKGNEVESAGDFGKHIPYDDYAETLTKKKKKKKEKKSKYLGSTLGPGWHMGSSALSEQREQSKKRTENFGFNGTSGLYAHQNAKKPKIMKHSLFNTCDNITLLSGSIPCPTASQFSNMSGHNKLMRYVGGRERSRKAKALKVSSFHSDPGCDWSLFEDQALVVLVHDMGPNWELVSDAINSTLQFKTISHDPKDCKERHKFLMDRNHGDGVDSADDSGSSNSYPSTLPGIPKGSARQLFQQLQGPVEVEALKEHFDKIILIAQKQHHQNIQLKNESQDLEQVPVNISHFEALSKVCPNNLNGSVLSPCDLIRANLSSPDVLPLGYHGSHASELEMQNQAISVSSPLTASVVNSLVPGSPGSVTGNNMPPCSPFNAPMRDGRHNSPKMMPSTRDERQSMQPYNQMFSNRAISQSNMPITAVVPGGNRSVCVMANGNSLGMNRTTIPMARPGFPGMASSSVLDSSGMLSPMVDSQSPISMHAGSGASATQVRHSESLQMPGGGHITELPRQMGTAEFPVHVAQSGDQGVPPFNGISPSISSQTSSPVQTSPRSQQQHYQISQQQSHANNHPHPQLQGTNNKTSQQKQISLRIAKERHLQQQQKMASNSLTPDVLPPSQPTMSTSLQNTPQILSQSLSPPASLSSLTRSTPMNHMVSQMHQEKNIFPDHSHSFPQNSQATVGGMVNQGGPKQRQRQAQQHQLQQSGRAHPKQGSQTQPHQKQAKVLMGIGRGNVTVHQNLPMDIPRLNSLSAAPGSCRAEEVIQQGQGLYSGTGPCQVQPSKAPIPQAPPHSQMLSGVAAPLYTKQQLQQVPSHSEKIMPGQFSDIPPGHGMPSTLHQAITTTVVKQHVQQPLPLPLQNQISRTQTVVGRMHPENHQHINYKQMLVNAQPNKAHVADQNLVNRISQVGIGSAGAAAAADGANTAIKVAWTASPVVPQRKVSEAAMKSTSTQVGANGSPINFPSMGHGGLGKRGIVDDLRHHGHVAYLSHGAAAKQSSEPLLSSEQPYRPQLQEPHEQAAP
ncbi:hypothetical protein SAY86_016062 [Trapa natans]|uniref:Uncharacterized protein n=1 Tax=Trapa natans TaxID=22666 RepID=A0AAN7LIX6_TRANT|nr:hypothetical protein SAY86_016062 [Trapa natans]